ncbi:hypothetical protein [Modestobacter sp. NPDC049651]|uniref:hypothetical protein n=1 Tax=unclassified Modestobacter TaxID=2643866 RepID=UPI0033CC59E0
MRTERPDRRGEARLPAALATALAIALYALLPDALLLGPRWVVPAIEVVLLGALLAVNPWRMTRETRWSRWVSLGLIALIAAANLGSLGATVTALVQQTAAAQDPGALLLAALQIWATNVLVFALAFSELDRGGPVARSRRPRRELPAADLRFSQDENAGAVREVAKSSSELSDWVPAFPDYLYVSLTNSSAFSPTDTMPLTTRVKALMGVEATAALLTSLLVIAAGVGQLGS